MADSRSIKLSHLRLDPINPRLDDGKQSQREALVAMLKAQGGKLVALARDINHNGLSPLDRFLVIDAEDSQGDYIVLEGNRRLTALKLLLNPELASGHLGAGEAKALKTLSVSSQYTGESEMDCVHVDSRDQAIHWLRLRHGGQLDGAGTVDWGSSERERFESRSGRSSPELQVLQFAVANGAISEDQAGLVSITNLKRLLSDSVVRTAIGIEIDRKRGKVLSAYPASEALKSLSKLLRDLASDSFRVADIYTKEHRASYVESLGRSHRPDPKTRRPAAVELTATRSLLAPQASKVSPVGPGRVKPHRKTVAPTTIKLEVPQQRLKDIHRELQRLRIEDHPNAGAVLLRVFLELSVDEYMKRRKIKPTGAKVTLSSKLQQVHDDLLTRAVMQKAELAPIRKAISGKDLMAASIPLFNLYVHEVSLTPSPGDVRTAWDNLELFFVRMWA